MLNSNGGVGEGQIWGKRADWVDYSGTVNGESLGIAGQPAAFRSTDAKPCFTRLPEFPDDLETIQISRREFVSFARVARAEGFNYVGGCCGCNAAYIRSMAQGLATGLRYS